MQHPILSFNNSTNPKTIHTDRIQVITKQIHRPKSNQYSIDYYDHNIIRPNEDIFLNNDPFANPQLTEKFFIKTPYIFTLNILNKKISAAIRDIQAYDSYFNKFNNFSLTFRFLTPKERDLYCSHAVMLRTQQVHAYTYYQFIQRHYTLNTPARQLHHRYQYINSKYTSPFFLTSPIVLKTLIYKASSEITIPSPRCLSSVL